MMVKLRLEILEERFNPANFVHDLTTGMTYATIQLAVTAADPGDILRADAGTYAEQVTINKPLTLQGARHGLSGTDASRTGLPTTESVVTGTGNSGKTPFNVTANGVTIDGFTVQDNSSPSNLGFGIFLGVGTSGSTVENNVIQNNIAGLSLANDPNGNPTVVRANLFRNNNNPGPLSGTSIYSDQINAGGTLANVIIDSNSFANEQSAAVLIGPTVASGATNLIISNNTFTGDGNAVLLFNTTLSSITGNTITSSTGSQIAVGGGVDGVHIANNFIQNGATRGIRVGDFGGGGTNQNVTINDNSISGNATAGLEIDSAAGAYTGTLDATNNWWGSPTGPTTSANPGGAGDKIVDPNGAVNFIPYLNNGADSQPNSPGFQPFPKLQATTTALVASPNPSDAGQSVTFTATVTPTSGSGTPTGSVQFFDGSTPLAMKLLSAGIATFSSSSLSVGTHTVTAAYSGAGNFAGSTSTGLPVTVVLRSTSTALMASPNPSDAGQSVTFTATVTPTSGSGTPTGSVQFFDGTTPLAMKTLNAGSATFNTSALFVGTHTISAVYSGGGNFAGSTSPNLPVTVKTRVQSIGAFDPTTGTWYLRNENSAGAADAGQFAFGAPGWLAVVGDWLGTDQATVAVVDPATETWYIRNSNTPGGADFVPFRFGAPGWIPVAGDWTGTGHAGIGVFDPNAGMWYLRSEVGPGTADAGVFPFGAPGWIPVVGDWANTGHAGIGAVDPGTETWYLRNTPNAGGTDFAPFAYGALGWRPVVGDWTGSGHAGVGVVDPGNLFYLRSAVGPGGPDVGIFAYGAPGWVPVAGQWKPIGPLEAASTGPGGAQALDDATLQNAVSGALNRLKAAGVDASVVQLLASARYQVTALPSGLLGAAYVATNVVQISADAAGNGWFVDPTPLQDEEFSSGQAIASSAAAGRTDLLSTLLHEMGHLAGLPDQNSGNGLMAEALATGTRRTDALDKVFSGGR